MNSATGLYTGQSVDCGSSTSSVHHRSTSWSGSWLHHQS